MTVRRAEVVMVDWIYSDRTGSKFRPAVVVQADFLNGRIADTVLIAVTRTTRVGAATQVILDPAVETQSGLFTVSVASCNNIETFDQALVRRTIGTLSAAAMQRIEAAIKATLGLP